MADADIHYKLDLIVHLVDTTTGKAIEQRQVTFQSEEQVVPFLRRDDGLYILLNRGRKDMDLKIQVVGFLPAEVRICYTQLQEQFPKVEVAMIPEISPSGFIDMVTMEGQYTGMESIVAVPLKNPYGVVARYLEKKQILRLYGTKPLKEMAYAVIHEQQQEFEEFQIKKRIDKLNVKLAEPLKTACRPEEMVVRIVRGRVDASGNYLLRLQEDAGGIEYMIRYVVAGKVVFKRITTESFQLIGESEEGGV